MLKSGNIFLIILLSLTMLVVAALHLLRPVNDPDFFWHLKTGEWIWQHRDLPSEDPFAFTTSKAFDVRRHFVLTSAWFTQVIFYASYLAMGMKGIVVLRFVISGLIVGVVLIRQDGSRPLSISLAFLFLIMLLDLYSIERPHVISFIFFPLLILLLERVRGARLLPAGPAAPILVPLLMLLWANMHGGHILGQTVICLYIVLEGIKFISPSLRPIGKRAYTMLCATGLSGLAFSFVNPNTYHAFEAMRANPTHNNIEFLSVIEIFGMLNSDSLYIYWFFLALAALCVVISMKSRDITETALVSGIAAASFYQARYIVFLPLAALPIIVRTLSGRRFTGPFMIVLSLAAGIYFSFDELGNLRNAKSDIWINPALYPAGAADFIEKNDLKGNMYNHYNWGGYLIWRLAPERQVFIDGRSLDETSYALATRINDADPGDGLPVQWWEAALESYGVRYVLIPLFQPSGRTLPLLGALIRSSEWVPVFFQQNSMIFVKKSPENSGVLRKYSIPKEYFIDDLLAVCSGMIKTAPANIFPYIARGDLFQLKGRPMEARESYQIVLRLAPANMTAKKRLEALNGQR